MASMNRTAKGTAPRTHEGAIASHITPEQQLRRSLMSCMLWESAFYESGQTISDRLEALVGQVDSYRVASLMIEARSKMYLRHAPLLIACALAKKKGLRAADLAAIIQRADELTEFVALYASRDGNKDRKNGGVRLSAQAKKGLALAFPKFDAYALGKYDQKDKAVRLRDVLFLCHAKPKDDAQAQVWKQLIDGTLPEPDTWEVSLSSSGEGTDKRAKWERLLRENKLGGLALLRNLRNFKEARVDDRLVREYIYYSTKTEKILPFRFIAAARYAPQWEAEIEQALFRSIAEQPKLPGKTVVLVDVSGSMDSPLSAKSDMKRVDAACGVAVCAREMFEQVAIYSCSNKVVAIPSRRGFALRDAIVQSQSHQATYLGGAVTEIDRHEQYDRLIVVTDEQSNDVVPSPKGRGYKINVASCQNGVAYGDYVQIDGWSDAVLRYIAEYEKLETKDDSGDLP